MLAMPLAKVSLTNTWNNYQCQNLKVKGQNDVVVESFRFPWVYWGVYVQATVIFYWLAPTRKAQKYRIQDVRDTICVLDSSLDGRLTEQCTLFLFGLPLSAFHPLALVKARANTLSPPSLHQPLYRMLGFESAFLSRLSFRIRLLWFYDLMWMYPTHFAVLGEYTFGTIIFLFFLYFSSIYFYSDA